MLITPLWQKSYTLIRPVQSFCHVSCQCASLNLEAQKERKASRAQWHTIPKERKEGTTEMRERMNEGWREWNEGRNEMKERMKRRKPSKKVDKKRREWREDTLKWRWNRKEGNDEGRNKFTENQNEGKEMKKGQNVKQRSMKKEIKKERRKERIKKERRSENQHVGRWKRKDMKIHWEGRKNRIKRKKGWKLRNDGW